MSNLLRALQNPPFGWFYAWTPLNEDGMPNINHTSALKQPETIKIRWDDTTVTSVNNEEIKTNHCEKQADVVPDKGIFCCEFAMIHTFQSFDSAIKTRMNDKDEKYVARLYNLMGKCF